MHSTSVSLLFVHGKIIYNEHLNKYTQKREPQNEKQTKKIQRTNRTLYLTS